LWPGRFGPYARPPGRADQRRRSRTSAPDPRLQLSASVSLANVVMVAWTLQSVISARHRWRRTLAPGPGSDGRRTHDHGQPFPGDLRVDRAPVGQKGGSEGAAQSNAEEGGRLRELLLTAGKPPRRRRPPPVRRPSPRSRSRNRHGCRTGAARIADTLAYRGRGSPAPHTAMTARLLSSPIRGPSLNQYS
jgi:hypothetical protein